MPASEYLSHALLDSVLQGDPWTPPADVYAALHTADPTPAGTAGEVTGGGYARQLTTWAAATGKTSAQTDPLAFPNMPQVTPTWISLWDAPTGGNMLIYGQLTAPEEVTAGNTSTIAPNALTAALN